MKKKRPTEDAAVRHASMIEILASTAISGMKLVDCILATDPNENYEPSQKLARQLQDQIEVLSAAAQEYEELFKMIQVELPPHFAAVRIKNPYYEGNNRPASSNDEKAGSEFNWDDPF